MLGLVCRDVLRTCNLLQQATWTDAVNLKLWSLNEELSPSHTTCHFDSGLWPDNAKKCSDQALEGLRRVHCCCCQCDACRWIHLSGDSGRDELRPIDGPYRCSGPGRLR